MPSIERFRGLNNVTDPLSLGLEWLVQADNVDVTNRGKLVSRTGYTRTLAASISSAYATLDEARLYAVIGTNLSVMAGSASALTLASVSAAPMSWTEINGQVFFNNGVDSGVIAPDNTVRHWAWTLPTSPDLAAVSGSLAAGQYQVVCTFTLPDGRETGTSDPVVIDLAEGQALQVSAIPQVSGYTTNVYIAPANSSVFGLAWESATAAMVWNGSPDDLGRESSTNNLSPLPDGCSVIQAWKGRIFAAQYFPEMDQSVIWESQPLGFHLFNLRQDGMMVPGKVLMLAPHDDGLVIGTDRAVNVWTGEAFGLLAPYGVVPGRHWDIDDDKTILFWTTRGVCRALPFSNLTQNTVSVAPGINAGGCIVRQGGQKRYLAAIQQGGSAFNSH